MNKRMNSGRLFANDSDGDINCMPTDRDAPHFEDLVMKR